MFKTELHLHTNGVSSCCDCPAEVAIERYLAAGYRTLVVTDHYHSYYLSQFPSHEEAVAHFVSGAERYRTLADGRMTVLSAIELRLDENCNDYLVYGVTPEFLSATPELTHLRRREAFAKLHEAGALIFQAHPFRNRMTVLPPDGLDGVEVFNAHNGHDSRNSLAYAYANLYGLAGIAGTDFHHLFNQPTAGILSDASIPDMPTLLTVLREKKYHTFGEIAPKE